MGDVLENSCKEVLLLFQPHLLSPPHLHVIADEIVPLQRKLYAVGEFLTTNLRRARAKVLKVIMDDHVMKFKRILDHKYEVLRI